MKKIVSKLFFVIAILGCFSLSQASAAQELSLATLNIRATASTATADAFFDQIAFGGPTLTKFGCSATDLAGQTAELNGKCRSYPGGKICCSNIPKGQKKLTCVTCPKP